jgi:catalase
MALMITKKKSPSDPKQADLDRDTDEDIGQLVTTDQHVSLNDDRNSPSAAMRGYGPVYESQGYSTRETIQRDPAPSKVNKILPGIKSRKVAILVADGVDDEALIAIQKALQAAGAKSKVITSRRGTVQSAAGATVPIDLRLPTTSSVMFDAVFIPGGYKSITALKEDAEALHFVDDVFKHYKTIGASGEGCQLLEKFIVGANPEDHDPGLVVGSDVVTAIVAKEFINAIACHRHWGREKTLQKVSA